LWLKIPESYRKCVTGIVLLTHQDNDRDQEMLSEIREGANLVQRAIILHFHYPHVAFIRIRHTDKFFECNKLRFLVLHSV